MKALKDMSKHCGQTVPGLAAMDDARRDKLCIQQMVASGTSDPLGKSSRDKSKDERGGDEGRKDEEKKKKKDVGNEEPVDLTEDDPGEGPGEDMKKPALDLKKPSVTAVDEVRQALGVSAPSGQNPMGSGTGGGGLPSLDRAGFGASRLPTPPGDGLSAAGRSKVRAGIRLEPIKR